MKKLILLIITIIIAFIIFLYFYLKPRNYIEEYTIDNHKIVEKYLTKEKVYYFKIDNKYDFIKEYKYTTKRKYVNSIKLENNNLIVTLKDNSKFKINFEEEYNVNVYNNYNIDLIKKYQDINIYNYKNFKFLIWDYKNIINIDKNKITKLKIFDKDAYDTNLFTKIEDLLVIPNLEDKYEFNKILIYDIQNNKKEIWELDYTISNDSYILGIINQKIYLVDNKYQKEYQINPFKKKIEIIGNKNKLGKIYLNGWQDISITKLINKEYKFEYLNIYNYYLEDNTIFLKYLDSDIITKITDYENIKIYKIEKANIYYLKNDILYVFNPEYGEIKLLERFEWNFNYENKIFIYE